LVTSLDGSCYLAHIQGVSGHTAYAAPV
jgi:hypothetical protein